MRAFCKAATALFLPLAAIAGASAEQITIVAPAIP
jgi:hypothetical protein